jgi:hypothetical protein
MKVVVLEKESLPKDPVRSKIFFCDVYFNIILHLELRLNNGLSSLQFSPQTVYTARNSFESWSVRR